MPRTPGQFGGYNGLGVTQQQVFYQDADGNMVPAAPPPESYTTPIPLDSPPATLSAGANTALTFEDTVYVVTVENNSGEDKRVKIPSPAGAGSSRVLDGEKVEFAIAAGTTTLGIYGASATPLNDEDEAVGVIVEGRA